MKLASEILILSMMIMSNGRVFVTKKSKVDALVMLSPLAFFLSILHLIAFSVDLFSVVILFVAILVLLSNFHALFRYSSRLIVDSYSVLMKIWAVVTVALATSVLIAVIIFKPAELNNEKLGVTETRTTLSGNFIGGFREAETFAIADGLLFEYAPKDLPSESKDQIIIFMPDKRGDTQSYKPYLQLLAQLGFICYSADFFAKDGKWLHTFDDRRITRRIGLIIRSLNNKQKFENQREFYTYNFTREFIEMLNLLDKKYGNEQKYFFVTDKMGFDAANDVQKKSPEKVAGIFDLSTVDLYKTSGYGFVELTDPLLAIILGTEKDKTLFNVKYAILKTTEAIRTQNDTE